MRGERKNREERRQGGDSAGEEMKGRQRKGSMIEKERAADEKEEKGKTDEER